MKIGVYRAESGNFPISTHYLSYNLFSVFFLCKKVMARMQKTVFRMAQKAKCLKHQKKIPQNDMESKTMEVI